MHPTLLKFEDLKFIGDLEFHSYAAMLALAFLVSALLAAREGMLLKSPVYVPVQGAVWTLVGALFGSRVFFILQYEGPTHLYKAFQIWTGGLVFYGGLIGAFIFTAAYLYITKQMDWRIADVCAPFLALGQAIGRFGCFLNGCCWGIPADVPWAVKFPRLSHAWSEHAEEGLIVRSAETSLPVHPTQLYCVLGLVFICLYLRNRLKKGDQFLFAIALQYCFLYGLLRFLVEMFRGDSARSVFGIMTVSQTISLGLVVWGAVVYWILDRRHRRRGDEVRSGIGPSTST